MPCGTWAFGRARPTKARMMIEASPAISAVTAVKKIFAATSGRFIRKKIAQHEIPQIATAQPSPASENHRASFCREGLPATSSAASTRPSSSHATATAPVPTSSQSRRLRRGLGADIAQILAGCAANKNQLLIFLQPGVWSLTSCLSYGGKNQKSKGGQGRKARGNSRDAGDRARRVCHSRTRPAQARRGRHHGVHPAGSLAL